MKAVRKWNAEKIQEGIYSVMKKNKTENMPSSKLIYPTCDIFVAYCIKDQEQIKKVYVIPSVVLQGKTQLSIGEKTSIYDKYLNAWGIIDDYKNFLMFVKNRGNI